MKKTILSLVLVAAALFACNKVKTNEAVTAPTTAVSTTVVAAKIITPKGPITQVAKSITGFSAVQASNQIKVVLTMGAAESVVVETNEDIQQFVTTVKVGNKLVLGVSAGTDSSGNANSIDSAIIKVFVTANAINALQASSVCNITVTNKLMAANLDVRASSGGSINADVQCTNIVSSSSTSGRINLTGTSDDLNLRASNASRFDGFGFATNIFTCQNASSAAQVNLTVNQTVKVTATSRATVNFKGNGVVIFKKLTGGAALNKL